MFMENLKKYKLIIINVLMFVGLLIILFAPETEKYATYKSFFGGFLMVGILFNIVENVKLMKDK